MSEFDMYINICSWADAFTGCVLQCMPWTTALAQSHIRMLTGMPPSESI